MSDIQSSSVADLLLLVETITCRLEAYDIAALHEIWEDLDDLKELILMFDSLVGPINVLRD